MFGTEWNRIFLEGLHFLEREMERINKGSKHNYQYPFLVALKEFARKVLREHKEWGNEERVLEG